MIPFRDTVEQQGPIAGVLIAMGLTLAIALTGTGNAGNVWQLFLALIGLWLFGAYLSRRLGTLGFLGVWVVTLAVVALFAGLFGDEGPRIEVLPTVLGLGLIHLATVPWSRILCLLPVPFAMTFFEVPTVIVLAFWAGLELLLGQI